MIKWTIGFVQDRLKWKYENRYKPPGDNTPPIVNPLSMCSTCKHALTKREFIKEVLNEEEKSLFSAIRVAHLQDCMMLCMKMSEALDKSLEYCCVPEFGSCDMYTPRPDIPQAVRLEKW